MYCEFYCRGGRYSFVLKIFCGIVMGNYFGEVKIKK